MKSYYLTIKLGLLFALICISNKRTLVLYNRFSIGDWFFFSKVLYYVDTSDVSVIYLLLCDVFGLLILLFDFSPLFTRGGATGLLLTLSVSSVRVSVLFLNVGKTYKIGNIVCVFLASGLTFLCVV